MPDVRLMPRTTVFGWYDGNVFGALERVNKHVAAPLNGEPVERFWKIMAKRAVLAAGAHERPLVFGGNDRPGVMTASAARTYVNRYGVSPGRSGIVFTNNDSGYRTARDLVAAGIEVRAIVDSRDRPPALDGGGVPVLKGVVADVKGSRQVAGVEIAGEGGTQRLACDFLAVSGGWNPAVHLACHRGARPAWDDKLACFLPPETGPALRAVGAAAGRFSLSDCLKDGAETGRRRPPSAASRQGARHPAGSRRAPLRHHAAVVGEGVEVQGLRRPAERRHRQGRAAGGPRRLQ
jgi:NADPH-dependent 2,4-dienoyl-CoA reductase/sulfur reductase-like enzyme